MIDQGALVGRHLLGHWPTALEALPRLSKNLGGPRIMIKRDDCSGLGAGGNKARKLEYLVAEALTSNADTLITAGAVQSNHARQTAAAAARVGLGCEIIAMDRVPIESAEYRRSGNRLLTELFGATLHDAKKDVDPEAALMELADKVRQSGRIPYRIPFGGSSAVGALGYVQAASELLAQFKQQDIDIDLIVHATGSGGTQAGLLAGLRANGSAIPVSGISVVEDAPALKAKIVELVEETAQLIGSNVKPPEEDVHVFGDYVGDAYGIPTKDGIGAVKLLATIEGILLDPVYTSKAMAGLIDLVQRGKFRKDQTIVFLHTGGAPALFSYTEELQS